MTKYRGYRGRSLELLKRHGVAVGSPVRIGMADMTYLGIIMPRYEYLDDMHVVLKLENGYNVGLDVKDVESIEKTEIKDAQVTKTRAPVQKKGLPNILLLSTGGTIASRVDYRTGAVTPVLNAAELNASVPELAEMANIETSEIISEYSENIQPEHWVQIADRVSRCADSGYAGIIIAHGTDTMHYTSSFLSFALSGFPIPIVLVGSQRSSDRASSDAALNITGAARLITKCGVPGVYIAMHQDRNDSAVACHAGTRVRKNHTSKRGAFQTIGESPAFIVSGHVQRNRHGGFFSSDKFESRIKFDSRAALVKYHPGFDPRLLDNIVDMGYRGIIFEGTGLGHVGNTMYEGIRRAHSKGVFLGMTSQCIDGRVSMTVYESGRDLLEMGITPLEDMIPETALVKLMWALGNFDDPKDVRSVMLKNIASETNR